MIPKDKYLKRSKNNVDETAMRKRANMKSRLKDEAASLKKRHAEIDRRGPAFPPKVKDCKDVE